MIPSLFAQRKHSLQTYRASNTCPRKQFRVLKGRPEGQGVPFIVTGHFEYIDWTPPKKSHSPLSLLLG
jgi:hypothetical protein